MSHHLQYPPGTTRIFSYFESRGGKFPTTVFFGLQYILKRYLVGQVISREKIDEADAFYRKHFGERTIFHREGWLQVLEVSCPLLSISGLGFASSLSNSPLLLAT